ncbi:MAG: N(1)-aminopropylagmatine ureohydrolase [Gammaproteobacteria bacterium]|jgi:agmatinase|nr:N(1)-aminopropylagmatine ureohydrolase [Gammaproteobacteria bacterium]
MKKFDPNAAAPKDSGIFGLPYDVEEARLVLIPVPWEVTTSYGKGTAKGPQAILQASKQIDLFDMELGNFFEAGIAMMKESSDIQKWNKEASKLAEKIIAAGGADSSSSLQKATLEVNKYSIKLNEYVYTTAKDLIARGKRVGVVGGDHSTPFGAIQAFLEKYPAMGILHFDAHADLRAAFEGFEYSHASIMHNVMEKTALPKLVQVGIRDFCEEEFNYIKNSNQRIVTFFDSILVERKLNGIPWSVICEDIIECLPKEIYISFDIDGLDPRFCPHTGTPVPGGLDLLEVLFLIRKVAQSGRHIIGFDINEVSVGNAAVLGMTDSAAEWDANVGARLLYKLCGWTLANAHVG